MVISYSHFQFASYGLNCFINMIPLRNVINFAANVYKTNFKMTFIVLKNYYFRSIIKNSTKFNILKTYALKNRGKFVGHNLEKLCLWCLASTIPVLGLKGVCPRKVGPWPSALASDFLSPWSGGLEGCVLDSTLFFVLCFATW